MNQQASGIKSYLDSISKHHLLTKEEEYTVFERLRNGDESARELIICCNLRLVVRLAQRFGGKGLSMDDLIQEGNIGLMEVINRFDHNLGFRFSTYAAFWIRQAMQVAVRRHGSMIRLPVRKARMLGRMAEIYNEFQSTLGRRPTTTEMAQRLELTETQVEELSCLSRKTLSLDTPLDEDGATLGAHLPDGRSNRAVEVSMQHEMTRKVHRALEGLSERENAILKMRFGIAGRKPRSLRSISRSVGLSQEGVRRVEQRALAKLGRPHMKSQLSGLL